MSFNTFGFHQVILSAVHKCGYNKPTDIQHNAIPHVLQKKDVLGLAQTGTGKTAAFVLPIIQNLLGGTSGNVRTLILTPTRELAEQIDEYVKKIANRTSLRCLSIYGGVSKNAQTLALKRGVDIIVACPGRLLDHLGDKNLDLSSIETLVLDEADHMFDKGFLPDIRKILRFVPNRRQTLVFSATMPSDVRSLVENILTDPVTVQMGELRPISSVIHRVYHVEQEQKTELLKDILKQKEIKTALIFTRTKHRARKLALQLKGSNLNAISLQGNMSQAKRQSAMNGFKKGTYKIMVATDIAARGIDVTEISHVINYDVPDTVQAYTHRTGRTGRAQCTGTAFTFVTAADESIIKKIEKNLEYAIQDIPFSADRLKVYTNRKKLTTESPEVEKRQKKRAPGRSRYSRAVPFDFGVS
jgi:ATP-dependent RNA helicase RhlE